MDLEALKSVAEIFKEMPCVMIILGMLYYSYKTKKNKQ